MGELGALTKPRPLKELPDLPLAGFACGEPSLNAWLIERARRSDGRSARTYVVLGDGRIAAYYCLSAGCVARRNLPSRLGRNMPDPVPVIVLGRLAVDVGFKNRGLGTALLRHALVQTVSAAEIIGCRALIVHALNDAVAAWYARLGFAPMPEATGTLYLPVETIAASLA